MSTPTAMTVGHPRRCGTDSYLAQLLADRALPGVPTGGDHRPVPAPMRVDAGTTNDPDRDALDAATALSAARTRARTGHLDTGAAHAAGAWASDCLDACTRTAADPLSGGPADWTRFGTVIPVLGASPGVGASVLCAVIADAAAGMGHRVLLVDAADPLRSGLRSATDTDGMLLPGPHPAVGVRQGWRGPTRTAHVEFTGVPVRSPGMVPAPEYWMNFDTDPDGDTGVDVTVVDLGWDAWALAAHPLRGPGAWLRTGTPRPRPVLAVAPSGPGARAAEQLLERLDPWCSHGGVSAPAAVAVMRTRRVPGVLTATAGHRLDALLPTAVAVEEDRVLAPHGVRGDPTSARLQQAVVPLLTGCALPARIPTSTPVRSRRPRRAASHTPFERTPS